MAVACITTNTDSVYELIGVFTCETQVAAIAVSGVTPKVCGIALLVVGPLVIFYHFNKLTHAHD